MRPRHSWQTCFARPKRWVSIRITWTHQGREWTADRRRKDKKSQSLIKTISTKVIVYNTYNGETWPLPMPYQLDLGLLHWTYFSKSKKAGHGRIETCDCRILDASAIYYGYLVNSLTFTNMGFEFSSNCDKLCAWQKAFLNLSGIKAGSIR